MGLKLESIDGSEVEETLGNLLGKLLRANNTYTDGESVGILLGTIDGSADGCKVFEEVGSSDGMMLGSLL